MERYPRHLDCAIYHTYEAQEQALFINNNAASSFGPLLVAASTGIEPDLTFPPEIDPASRGERHWIA
jgi:hypothetical protein